MQYTLQPMVDRVLVLILATLAIIAVVRATPAWADSKVVRLSDPVTVTEHYEVFGAPMGSQASQREGMTLQALLEDAASHLNEEVTVTTRVAQVCQKKGCFFIAQEGKHSARVSFKDYGFFVPSNISGRTVTLAGTLLERDITAAQAQHLRQDTGGEGNIQAGKHLEIVASSVRIPL